MSSFRRHLILDLKRLRVLRELHSRSTIVATARALHLTPSAISQQIAALSRDVGAPLLAPHGRGVRLTPQAELLLQHATLVDAQLERARADLAAMEAGAIGRIRLGAFATAVASVVAAALSRLRSQHAGLRLLIEEVEAPECFTRLDQRDLDIIITVDYRSGPHRNDPRYHRMELLDDPMWVVLPRRHPLARQHAIDLADLAHERWNIGASHGPCLEAALTACSAAGFNPTVEHRMNDWSALVRLVATGCGVALIPQLALEANPSRDVAVRRVSSPTQPNRHLYAAVRDGTERSPALAAVLSALAAAAKERAASTFRPAR
jgi:DNA-binding transcriptional LysR family regulator